MNSIWSAIIIVSLGLLLFFNPSIAFDSMILGSNNAIKLCLKLWAIYAVWLGLLQIVEDTKLDKKIAKLLSPIILFLFGKQKDEVNEQLAINITSNLTGMGNACTPSGIKAISLLDDGSKKLTTAMSMLIVLNTSSLQLLPTTVIGLRIAHGSLSPSDIIFPTLIATLASTLVGVALVKLMDRLKARVKK